MTTKQVRNLRPGDIVLFKNKESRLITSIDYHPFRVNPYSIRTTDLKNDNPRIDTFIGIDRVIVWVGRK